MGRGGGTSIPGMVARRLDPGILRALVADQGVPVIAITGSNGKTTTARFAAAILRGAGLPVAHNQSGANLVQGVTSLAVSAADLRGHVAPVVMVAEIDEGALPLVAPEIRPQAVLVTNLFRDQLDRYGEIYAVADAFEVVAAALPPDSVLVVNADDPIVAGLAPARDGRRVTFGLDLRASTDAITRAADTIRCPACRANLEYEHVYLSHMGAWRCPACGLARPPLDVAVTSVEVKGLAETRFAVRTAEGEQDFAIPQSGLHVAYDAAAAVALAVGLGVPLDGAPAALAGVGPAFGRLERITAGDREIVLGFAKNPTSYNATLRALATEDLPRHLLIAVSNTLVDGEDFGWLWDVDFEASVARIETATVSGLRADELANRLKYAGLDPVRMAVITERVPALDAALAATPPGEPLTIVAGYTPTIELREEMRRRGWVGRYWEA
jgi:lipid II isoglutaminyl synthase (glutamine-hydrolysing)